jgi:hypothetical protein
LYLDNVEVKWLRLTIINRYLLFIKSVMKKKIFCLLRIKRFTGEIKKLNPLYFLFALFIISYGCKKKEDPPVSDFTFIANTVNIGDSVTFTNNSIRASHYKWTFGDGQTALTKDALHVYLTSGIYTITLVATGEGNSTSSKNITVTGETNIIDGIGTKKIKVGYTWAQINSLYPGEDTIHMVEAYNKTLYLHFIYYFNQGVGMYIMNQSKSSVNNGDMAFEVMVSLPYEGYTKKGITLGDDMNKVKAFYGAPEIYNGTNTNFYYYDFQGIEFWTSTNSTTVNVIGIYTPANSSGGGISFAKAKEILLLQKLNKRFAEHHLK